MQRPSRPWLTLAFGALLGCGASPPVSPSDASVDLALNTLADSSITRNTVCLQGQHACGATCVSNTISGCSACGAGYHLCNATCVPDSFTGCPTSGCPNGTHRCGGTCFSNTDPIACGTSCMSCPAPGPHMMASCNGTACGAGACEPGYGNCDADASDGCEVNTATDADHCGACGNRCALGQGCMAGACVACGTAGVACAPRLVAAVAQDNLKVLVRFSEPVQNVTAAQFTISPSLRVERADQAATGGGTDWYLTTPRQSDVAYTITARGEGGDLVRDASGTALDERGRTATFLGISEMIDVITEVRVNVGEPYGTGVDPANYTALNAGRCTEPYVRGTTGTRRTDMLNITEGFNPVSPARTNIWARYMRVPRTSHTPVLTGITAVSAPLLSSGWDAAQCPPGYRVASGEVLGQNGALTAGTGADCGFNKLCVRYEFLDEVIRDDGRIITALALTDSNSTVVSACPVTCTANGVASPMLNPPRREPGSFEPDSQQLSLRANCTGSRRMTICTNNVSPRWPSQPSTPISVTDAERLSLLTTYAPRVRLATGELYWPSSVEYTFQNMTRHPGTDGNYRLRTTASFDQLATQNPSVPPVPYLVGQNPATTTGGVPVYALWAEKSPNGPPDPRRTVVDLLYFMYYPYNLGKSVAGAIFGNHIGDWEYVSVRLAWEYDLTRGWVYGPSQFLLGAHSFGAGFFWPPLERVQGTQHPVVYSAYGSHGLWATAGNHPYQNIGVTNLTDVTSAGTAWDTWNRLVAFNFPARQGLGGAAWPRWLDTDYTAPGPMPSNPTSGPIHVWGNPEGVCPFTVCDLAVLVGGPTGPASKGVWSYAQLQ